MSDGFLEDVCPSLPDQILPQPTPRGDHPIVGAQQEVAFGGQQGQAGERAAEVLRAELGGGLGRRSSREQTPILLASAGHHLASYKSKVWMAGVRGGLVVLRGFGSSSFQTVKEWSEEELTRTLPSTACQGEGRASGGPESSCSLLHLLPGRRVVLSQGQAATLPHYVTSAHMSILKYHRPSNHCNLGAYYSRCCIRHIKHLNTIYLHNNSMR